MRISDWSSDVCSSDLCFGSSLRAQWERLLGDRIAGGQGKVITVRQASAGRRSPTNGRDEKCGRSTRSSNPFPAAPSWLANVRCRRSEEHTSELQSLMRISYAVFCLKKKKKSYNKSY